MMSRLFRSSCLGLLTILMFGSVAILSILAVMFQQSQAVRSNIAATIQVRVTPTLRTLPAPLPVAPSQDVSAGEVTIQIQTTTPMPSTIAAPTNLPDTPTQIGTSGPDSISSDVPRYSGTSSYPLTVTAEVVLGLTHVANYQAGVAATRTAIAAESASVYATLTALAPTPTVSVP